MNKPNHPVPKGFEGIISQAEWNDAKDRYDRSRCKAEMIRRSLKGFADRARSDEGR